MIKHVQQTIDFEQIDISKAKLTVCQKIVGTIIKNPRVLPICIHCKKNHYDKGYWNQVEAYIQKNSQTSFSQSICRQYVEKYCLGVSL